MTDISGITQIDEKGQLSVSENIEKWEKITQIDEKGQLFVSGDLQNWGKILENKINVIFDLDGDIDEVIPKYKPQQAANLVYVYFPFEDSKEKLSDLHLKKLHEIAKFGANMIENGYNVLSHCAMGHNRSVLLAGVILTYLGMTGDEAVKVLQGKREGALYNHHFYNYLKSLQTTNKGNYKILDTETLEPSLPS